MTGSLVRVLAASVLAATLLGGCGSDPVGDGRATSLDSLVRDELSAIEAVKSVEVRQEPVGATEDADRLDPDLWTLDVDVTMVDGATEQQVATGAKVTREVVEKRVGSARWTARLTLGALRPAVADGPTALPAVQVEVYPTVQRTAAEDARAAMQVKDVAGVSSVAVTAGRPGVQVSAPQDLVTVLRKLRPLAFWDAGGSVQTQEGRLRFSDVPARVTPAQVRAIVDVAVSHPGADVALESSGDSPELYVNKVTPAEAREIEATLTSPSLASTTDDGFVLEFNVRATDATRTIDSHGTFGVQGRS